MPFFQGVSYDATFESVEIPAEILAMRDQRARKRGARVDDVEFTFIKGRWGHLGEATLFNRIKSHQDVGERWYPDILRRIREEQAATASAKKVEDGGDRLVNEKERVEKGMEVGDGVQAIRAHG